MLRGAHQAGWQTAQYATTSAWFVLCRMGACIAGGGAQVELPLGATEDRICGTIDIEKALMEGIKAYEPGLLVAPSLRSTTAALGSIDGRPV